MLSLNDLDADQIDAIDVCFESDHTFLIGGMGSGKTIIALSAAEEMIVAGLLNRVLVLAPLKVCNAVWKAEHEKWEHTHELQVQILSKSNREIDPEADIVVINFDLLPWAADQDMFKHFDGLIVDESTKMKAGGKWFKSIRHHIKNFKWRLVMTGTPVSENWQQLFYQMFLVDGGETFGRNNQKFLEKWFYPTDWNRYNWAVKPGQEGKLTAMIAPFIHDIPDYRDSLPPLTIDHPPAPLPAEAMRKYKQMAGTLKTEGVTAQTAAIKSMKLTQIANGFIYDDKGATIRIHESKADVLKKLMKKIRKMGVGNILIIYQFKAELAQLRELVPGLVTLDDDDAIPRWNSGRLNTLAMHPKSGGHGLNLAAGGHDIIWLSPPWSRDLLDQTNARLWRRGQDHAVSVQILTAPDTIDSLILARLDSKAAFMPAFLSHLASLKAA